MPMSPRRLAYETELEQQALGVLRQVQRLSAPVALDEAERFWTRPCWRRWLRICGPGCSKWPKRSFRASACNLACRGYKAIAVDRGANLDLIDVPLNNRVWLKARFAAIRGLEGEREQEREIDALVRWTDPGPGGFYDNLGSLTQRPHLVCEPSAKSDPEYRQRRSWAPNEACALEQAGAPTPRRVTNRRCVCTTTDWTRTPSTWCAWSIRGDNFAAKMRLVANERFEVHPYMIKPMPIRPVEFDVPPDATRAGSLTLAWTQNPGRGGNGRGCQVAEVWLIRKAP